MIELQEKINILEVELEKNKSIYNDKKIKFKINEQEIIAKIVNFHYNSTSNGDKIKIYLNYENISQEEINKLNLEDIFGYVTLSKIENLNVKLI
jgi:predicted RNA binding protein with dsRBD fold (UPF0201 family)